MRLAEIVDLSDRLFPFSEAEKWDNCGLQVGAVADPVNAVAFCLDPTPQTVAFAAEKGCELLITHHPLIMEPLRGISEESFVGRTVLLAARRHVAVLSLHTNLDAAPGGLNDHLAERLGLRNVSVPAEARCARTGALPDAIAVNTLAQKVARDLDIPNVRVISQGNPKVQHVFSATGSGMGYFQDALREGADVIVTGDVKYHAAREALEMGVPVIDGGHFGLEKMAVGLLAERFRNEFAQLGLDIPCIECHVEQEPFKPIS